MYMIVHVLYSHHLIEYVFVARTLNKRTSSPCYDCHLPNRCLGFRGKAATVQAMGNLLPREVTQSESGGCHGGSAFEV